MRVGGKAVGGSHVVLVVVSGMVVAVEVVEVGVVVDAAKVLATDDDVGDSVVVEGVSAAGEQPDATIRETATTRKVVKRPRILGPPLWHPPS